MEWRPKDIYDAKFSNADLSGTGMFWRLSIAYLNTIEKRIEKSITDFGYITFKTWRDWKYFENTSIIKSEEDLNRLI